MNKIKLNRNMKLKDPYLNMLNQIVTSGLPIKKMAALIEALKLLQKANLDIVNSRVAKEIKKMIENS